jgi:hypothetical protein
MPVTSVEARLPHPRGSRRSDAHDAKRTAP